MAPAWSPGHLFGAILFACACLPHCKDEGSVPDPVIVEVTPKVHSIGADEIIVIHGRYFLPRVSRSLAEKSEFQVNARFHVTAYNEVRAVALTGVTATGSEQLSAVAPNEMPPGWYAIEVETPLGKKGILENALYVEAKKNHSTDTEETDTDAETGTWDSETDVPLLSCAEDGVLYEDICWYMSSQNESCLDVCELIGGFHPKTPAFVGSRTQGATTETCRRLLTMLGHSEVTVQEAAMDMGLGCYARGHSYYWIPDTEFDEWGSVLGARQVCGCWPDGVIDKGTDIEPEGGNGEDVARFTSSTIEVDGYLVEDAWRLNSPITHVTINTDDDPAYFDLLWNDQYLFIGVRVIDDELVNDSPDDRQDDSVQFGYDGDHTDDGEYDDFDDHCLMAYNETSIDCAFKDSIGIRAATAVTTGGSYYMEIAVPWTHIGVDPGIGTIIGFDVGVNDDDGGGGNFDRDSQIRWAGTKSTWSDTIGFGEIRLIAEDPELVNDVYSR